MRAPASMKNAAARNERKRRGFIEGSLKEMKIQNSRIFAGLIVRNFKSPRASVSTGFGVSQFPFAPTASVSSVFRVSTHRSEKPHTSARAERNQRSRPRSSNPHIERQARWDKRAQPIA